MDLPYRKREARSESGKLSQEESLLEFHRFMGFMVVFFPPELQDCEVPDALCKTMPHRGKAGRGSVRSSLRPP